MSDREAPEKAESLEPVTKAGTRARVALILVGVCASALVGFIGVNVAWMLTFFLRPQQRDLAQGHVLFPVWWGCAWAAGIVAGKIACTINPNSMQLRRTCSWLALFVALYTFAAFHGSIHGVHAAPVLAPNMLGTYFGNVMAELGGTGIWVFALVCSFVLPRVAFAQAIKQRERIYLPGTELPLLRRELTELANRRRTYIVRIIGAVIILVLVIYKYHMVLSAKMQQRGAFGISGPTQFLGIGQDIFAGVVPQLFAVISLLLPALCCASVTSEKESNTIGTLLLTRLSPGTIVVEKFGSRLIPMLTLLLLTFPVLAHVYALGGVDTDLLIGTIWLLLCQCFLVAAMAIACSAWFASTVSAFICSYALVGFFAALTYSLQWSSFVPSAIWTDQFDSTDQWANIAAFGGPTVVVSANGLSGIVAASIPSLVMTVVLLAIARMVLVRRAFVSHSSIILKAFRALDRFFKRLNERTTGGVELIADADHPPDDDPIAWRERSKKSLGKARYLVRVLLALEFPVLFICMIAATASSRSAFQGLYILQGIVWTLCTLIVAVRAATLMSSERSRQTLEALLSTPLTAREILDQKIAGIRRLLIVMSVPILTVNLTHFLIYVDTSSISGFFSGLPRPSLYMALSATSTFVFLYLITWISAGLGTVIHSPSKAVIVAAVSLLLWIATPIIAAHLMSGFDYGYPTVYEVVISFSPYGTIRANEIYLIENYINGNLSSYRSIVTGDVPRLGLSVVSTLVQIAALLVVRGLVRKLAPALLQRRDSGRQFKRQLTGQTTVWKGVSA